MSVKRISFVHFNGGGGKALSSNVRGNESVTVSVSASVSVCVFVSVCLSVCVRAITHAYSGTLRQLFDRPVGYNRPMGYPSRTPQEFHGTGIWKFLIKEEPPRDS